MNLCNTCGKEASKQCSRCKHVYYCSITCQTSDWVTHKKKCIPNDSVNKKKDELTESIEKNESTKSNYKSFMSRFKISKIDYGDYNIFNDYTFNGTMINLDIDPIECCICLEMISSEYELCNLDCNHKLHWKCLHTFEQKGITFNCPLCRNKLKNTNSLFIHGYEEMHSDQSKKSFDYFLNSANQGSIHSAHNLSIFYMIGNGCEVSFKQGFKWLYISIYRSNELKITCIGYDILLYYFFHIHYFKYFYYWATKSSNENSIKYVTQIKEMGYIEGDDDNFQSIFNIISNENINCILLNQPLITKDMIYDIKTLADNGNKYAQYIYYNLNNEDIQYLWMAVEQELPKAIHELGLYYIDHKDYDNAYVYLKKAMDLYDYSESIHFIGLLYLIGNKYIHKDLEQAFEHLKLAYKKGYEEYFYMLPSIYVLQQYIDPHDFDYFEFNDLGYIGIKDSKLKKYYKILFDYKLKQIENKENGPLYQNKQYLYNKNELSFTLKQLGFD